MTGISDTTLRSIRVLTFILVIMALLASKQAYSKTVKITIFETFRYEMALSPDATVRKFMTRNAFSKWRAAMEPHFGGQTMRMNHFFASSMVLPRQDNTGFYAVYFNPWVDGALLTRWGKTGQGWKIEDFHLSSGERIRGAIPASSNISEKNILPVWMQKKGPILRNIFSYYKDMRHLLLNKKTDDYTLWFLLDDSARNLDLLLVKLRMRTRVDLALKYIAVDKMGKIFTRSFSGFKKEISTKNAAKLASYGPHTELFLELPPMVVNSLSDNWLLKTNNIYSAFLSSPAVPRWFVYVTMSATGKITGALFGDFEAMADLSPAAPPPIQATIPAQSVQQIQKFKTPKGELVEIVIEKKDGSEFMVTRINGKVIERLPL